MLQGLGEPLVIVPQGRMIGHDAGLPTLVEGREDVRQMPPIKAVQAGRDGVELADRLELLSGVERPALDAYGPAQASGQSRRPRCRQ